MLEIMYAEDIGNYWKTSRTSPDRWLEKTASLIEAAGGQITKEFFGRDVSHNRGAYVIEFTVENQTFRVTWPVLPSRGGNTEAAKRQAVTFMYHDIKAKLLSAKVVGLHQSMVAYMVLPNGRTVNELSSPDAVASLPQLLLGGGKA